MVTRATVAAEFDVFEPRQCVATAKSTGEQCERPPVEGAAVCRVHGGAAPRVQAAARRRVQIQTLDRDARIAAAELTGVEVVGDPFTVLENIATEVIAAKDFFAAKVAALKGEIRYTSSQGGTEQLRSEVAEYGKALDRTITVMTAIAKLNLEERRTVLTERQAELVANAVGAIVSGILSHVSPYVPPEQLPALTKKVRSLEERHLSAIG